MQYIFMALAALGIVALDQATKLWVVANIPLHSSMEAIPGIFRLTYVQNTGAAWSSFQGMIWLFTLVFLLFTVAIVWEFSKKRWPFTNFERWLIVAIYGGGLGNMIDRLRLGYVVDMVDLEFMNFPVFNIADCFISCGCILLIAHMLLFNKEFWKEEKK